MDDRVRETLQALKLLEEQRVLYKDLLEMSPGEMFSDETYTRVMGHPPPKQEGSV